MRSPQATGFRSTNSFMLLDTLVDTSQKITGTTKRLEKTSLLASLLKQLNPAEVEPAVGFLSGALRQGRIGIGYATLESATASAAAVASLEIVEVDRVLDEIAAVRGPGSEQRRRDLLSGLFGRATREEQHFLVRLL